MRALLHWLRHDVLSLAGPDLATQRELFDFLVAELAAREPADPRRIRPVRVALQNQRDDLLAFAGQLDAKLAVIACTHAVPKPLVRQALMLHRLPTTSPAYWQGWNQLRAQLGGTFHALFKAVLIIGQSGTGKTMATRKLYDELRKEIPGLARVPITLGPEQLRDDVTEAPVLYDIEDPWGRYDFDPKSRSWNDQLSQFLAAARPDRMIVATSRLDVAQSAGVLETVNPWRVGLEAEHYGGAERRRLYRTRIDALPTFDDKERRNPPLLVSEAIRRAH